MVLSKYTHIQKIFLNLCYYCLSLFWYCFTFLLLILYYFLYVLVCLLFIFIQLLKVFISCSISSVYKNTYYFIYCLFNIYCIPNKQNFIILEISPKTFCETKIWTKIYNTHIYTHIQYTRNKVVQKSPTMHPFAIECGVCMTTRPHAVPESMVPVGV